MIDLNMENGNELIKAGEVLVGCLNGSIEAKEVFAGIPSVSIIGDNQNFLRVVDYSIEKKGLSGIFLRPQHSLKDIVDDSYLFLDMDNTPLNVLRAIYNNIKSNTIKPKKIVFVWSSDESRLKDPMKWDMEWLDLSWLGINIEKLKRDADDSNHPAYHRTKAMRNSRLSRGVADSESYPIV